MPEVELPYEKSIFDEKLIYTVIVAALYLLMGLPLNGVDDTRIADPFSWLRGAVASSKATFLEFGVLPAAFSAFFWQVIAANRLIKVDFRSARDRQLFQTLQKVSSILLGFVFSLLLVFAGYFEPVDYIPAANASAAAAGSVVTSGLSTFAKALIVVELTTANGIVTLLAEILDKGYGFGPGILAIITISSATTAATSIFGLTTIATGRGSQSTGALIQLVRNFFSSKTFLYGIYEAFTRTIAANLTQVYILIAAFFALAYLANCRYEIAIKSTKVHAQNAVYPIKLLYCGALPVLFSFSVLYVLNIIGFSLSSAFPTSKYVDWIGRWTLDSETKLTYNLTSGFLYFISAAPASGNTVYDLIRPFTFTAFIVVVSAKFGRAWPAMSGSAARGVAQQLRDQDVALAGHRDNSATRELGKLITPAASAGALLSSLLVAACECTGICDGLVAGTTIGLLSGLSILEVVVTEWQQTGAAANSQLSQFLPMQ